MVTGTVVIGSVLLLFCVFTSCVVPILRRMVISLVGDYVLLPTDTSTHSPDIFPIPGWIPPGDVIDTDSDADVKVSPA